MLDAAVFTPITAVSGAARAELCLSGAQWDGTENAESRRLLILEPFSQRLDHLTPTQQIFVGDKLIKLEVVPVEDLFDVTINEIVQKAQEEDNPCFYSVPLFEH